MASQAAEAAAVELVRRTEERRRASSHSLDARQQRQLAQFFTPALTADFIASMARLPRGPHVRILDPGAGVGSLTASLVARLLREQPAARISITACEVDPHLHGPLRATLEDCVRTAQAFGSRVDAELVPEDFIPWACRAAGIRDLFEENQQGFDLVIMNPPYKKLARNSAERRLVESACTEVSNLYAAFLALGVHLLAPGGQMMAITPRSFANGRYFRPFRHYFLGRMHLDRIHLFESRSKVFSDDSVLQENVILSATRSDDKDRGPITVTASLSHGNGVVQQRKVAYDEMVHPGDREFFMHISADEEDAELAARLAALPSTLSELGIQVSTGRVVDFRSKEHLRPDPTEGAVPLIYPLHMRDGSIRWPVPGAKKNNAIMLNEQTERLTFPSGFYVVVKRLSAKEERRRVIAVVFDPGRVPCTRIGFENHVNVYHQEGAGLSKDLARGLCLWLNSTLLDRFIRRFNGHTQVNATDLRNLRYPSNQQLASIGHAWNSDIVLAQEKIDELVEQHLQSWEIAS